MIRTVKKIVTGTTQYDGAGVKLVRVLSNATIEDFDPFLMLDAFDSTDPADYVKGFPWHPHRGIETVTYLVHGDIEHGDSLGNSGSILDGCCQWMTAGGGIIHQEMPQASKRMLGTQLWLNLPAKDKMTTPQYGDIEAENVPVIRSGGSVVKVISGDYQGTPGAFQGRYVDMIFLDVELEPGSEWQFAVDPEFTLFVYIMAGAAFFPAGTDETAEIEIPEKRAVLTNHGETFTVRTGESKVHFLLYAGLPLHEPVAWGGPIVMNTREELRQAFRDIDEGTFIR